MECDLSASFPGFLDHMGFPPGQGRKLGGYIQEKLLILLPTAVVHSMQQFCLTQGHAMENIRGSLLQNSKRDRFKEFTLLPWKPRNKMCVFRAP